jgi:hypothetical protein
VRDTATGAITATVRCPWAQAAISGDIAAADHKTFFMACLRTRGSGANATVIGSRIYRFRVTGTGTVDDYSLVAALPGRALDGLAAAANGSALVTSTFRSLFPGPSAVLVINTRTGAHASWSPTAPATFAQDFSLSPNGRELRFLLFNGHRQEWAFLQVSPASRGGSLTRARVLVHLPPLQTISYAQVSRDGAVLTVVGVSFPQRAGDTDLVVEQISVGTGKIIRILFRAALPSITGFYVTGPGPSSDPSGRYIIVIYDDQGVNRNGWIDRGRLVPLAPAVAPAGLYETW